MSQSKFEKVYNALAAKQLADLSRLLRLPYAEAQRIAVAELLRTLNGK